MFSLKGTGNVRCLLHLSSMILIPLRRIHTSYPVQIGRPPEIDQASLD